MAAADIFMKLKDIKGESTDEKHKDEIEVLSWSWGQNNAHSVARGAGAGVGKVMIQDLTFSHHVDKASVVLSKFCIEGKHIAEGLLTMRKAGGKPLEYLKLKLTDVLITSVQTSGSGGGELPMEVVSLNFAKMEYDYTPQKADGSGDTAVKMIYDAKAGKVS